MKPLHMLIVGLILAPFTVYAADEKLPEGKALLKKYVEAIGGQEALDKQKTSVATIDMSINPAGVTGQLTVYTAEKKSLTVGEITGLGPISEGTDGEVYWESSPITGPRILEGKEKALKMLQHVKYDEYDQVMKSIATAALEEVNGAPAYKVVMTHEELDPISMWFDKDSGLIVKTEFRFDAPMVGNILIAQELYDYRPVQGVKAAHRIVQKILNVEQVLTVKSIRINEEIPAEKFALPEEVKQMLKRKNTPSPSVN